MPPPRSAPSATRRAPPSAVRRRARRCAAPVAPPFEAEVLHTVVAGRRRLLARWWPWAPRAARTLPRCWRTRASWPRAWASRCTSWRWTRASARPGRGRLAASGAQAVRWDPAHRRGLRGPLRGWSLLDAVARSTAGSPQLRLLHLLVPVPLRGGRGAPVGATHVVTAGAGAPRGREGGAHVDRAP